MSSDPNLFNDSDSGDAQDRGDDINTNGAPIGPHSDDDNESSSKPSKTQRKQAALALTALGRQLVELKPALLTQIALDDNISHAVEQARDIRSHVARKRQLQYLGKLLRHVDTDAISAQLEQILAPGRQEASFAKMAELWREQLLDRGNQALTEFLQQFPATDHQLLRQCLRQANQDPVKPKTKQAKKALYRELLQIIQQSHKAE